jgi:pimeloyl-ACP methyl ester carboxylesterase
MIDLRHDEVTVGDAAIHTVTAGAAEAPGLLLLHGWPESWVTWRELIPFAARDRRVVAIDLPGIGGSSRGASPGSKVAIAHTVHSLVETLGLTDVTLVGHDIGGMVTYAYLREFPDLPRAVIMDVPVPGVDPWDDFTRAPFLWHFALHSVPELPEQLVTGQQETYFGYFYDLLSAAPGAPSSATRREQAAAYAAPTALTAGFDWYRAFDGDVADNQAAACGSPTRTPLLYLRGSAERGGSIDTYVEGLRQAGLADVRPAVIGDAGHFPHEEATVATWRAISGFISDTSAGAPSHAIPAPAGRKDRT